MRLLITQSTRVFTFWVLTVCLLASIEGKAQVTVTVTNRTNTTPTLAASYGSLAAALTDLNLVTAMTGPVTLTCAAGSETAPSTAAGFSIGSATLNPVLSVTNQVTITTSGLVTLNAATTGVATSASAAPDGIVTIMGADYITFNGFTLVDGNALSPATMEYGIGLFKRSLSDGAQNNTISNCNITLNRENFATGSGPMVEGSVGIAVLNSTPTAATTALVPTAAVGSNSNNKFYTNTIQNCNYGMTLIGYAAASPFTAADYGNDVGGAGVGTGNIINNYGGGVGSANPAAAVRTLAQYNLNVSYNTTNNNNGAGVNHPSTLRGLYFNTATSANITVTNNNVTVKCGGTTSQLDAIENVSGSTAASNTINISNNSITTDYPLATSGVTYGIYNTATPANLTISGNTISMSTAATSGSLYGVYSSGSVASNLTVNNNNINNVVFTAASSSVVFRGIYSSVIGAAATITANGNNLTGLNYSGGTATGEFDFIYLVGTAVSETVSNNTVTNVTTMTTGAAYLFYLNNATPNVNFNNNSIVTQFSKNVSNAAVFFGLYNFASPTTGTVNINNNNFSNITLNSSSGTALTSSTAQCGIFWATAAGPTHNAYNNTISNITSNGSGYFQAMFIGYGSINSLYNNTISNITALGNLYGIVAGNSTTVNMDVYDNTITGLTTTGAATVVNGITVGTSSTLGPSGNVNLYRNRICTITANGATGVANGLNLFFAGFLNVYNNRLAEITAPNTTSALGVSGINVSTTSATPVVKLHYNTVYLSGTSLGTGFGSAALYTASASPSVEVRNNIFLNLSTPTGTGIASAHRRINTTLTTYAAASNNNIFYAGVASSTHLIYYDGTNSDQLLSTYKTRVSPRDNYSFSENPTFLSTTCANANFLKINTAIPTLAESGAANITGITNDFELNIRQGNAGYVGAGTNPDIGADEFAGTTTAPLIASATVTPSACTATTHPVSTSITTSSGTITGATLNYAYDGVTQTPISMTNPSGSTWTGTIPAATSPTNAVVTWNITAQNSSSIISNYVGTSYQDNQLFGTTSQTSASINPVCSGSPTNLMYALSKPGAGTVGAGLTTSATYSNPFYSLYSNLHIQHLVLASELTASGLGAGNITALALDITSAGTLPMLDLSVKMGATNAINTSSFISTTFTTVFTSGSLMPVTGINTMTFTTPFYWDGVSNIVIEICHGNPGSTATMSRTCRVDNTSYLSSIKTHNTTATSSSSQCGDNTTNVLAYPVRPQFRFTGATQINTITWSDGTSNIGSTTPLTINPTTTKTYTPTVVAFGCTVSSPPSTTVTVTPLPSAPTAANSTQCATSIVPTASATATAGGAGTGQLYWYSASNGGTLLQQPPFGALQTYYTNNFTAAPPYANTTLSGVAAASGGEIVLHTNTINQQGGITISASGYNSNQYQIDFDVTTSGTVGSMADGFSYSFGDDASATATSPAQEKGSGTKLKIGFDTYGSGADAAGIYLLYNNTAGSITPPTLSASFLGYSNNVAWVNLPSQHVTISINNLGQLSLSVGGTSIFTNVQLPASFLTDDKASWKHVIAGRTGSLSLQTSIDNLQIQANQFTSGYTTYNTAISSTTTFYVSELGTNGCQSTRTPVTATITPPPPFALTQSAINVCLGSSAVVSVTGGTVGNYSTYSWSGGVPSGSPVGATVTLTPSATTTYTAYASGGGCNATASVTATSIPLPATAPTATPPTICAGGTSQLFAGTFVTGTLTTPNSGTTNSSAATGFDITNTTAYPITLHYFSFQSNATAGTIATQSVYKRLSSMNCVKPTNVTTDPNYILVGSVSTTSNGPIPNPPTVIPLDVNVTIPAGATYSFAIGGASQQYYNGTSGCPIMASTPHLTVTEGWGGTFTSTIDARRWNGSVTYDYGDPSLTFSWTPSGSLNSPTSISPISSATSTTTYTVAATNSFGCVNTATTTVTVNPLPTATISGNTTLCQGSASPNITFTGASGTAPYTFTYKINGGANQFVTTVSGNSVTIPVSTSTAGTFAYTLVSVADANTCSQAQVGSATVTVHASVTANGGVDKEGCSTATVTMTPTTPSVGTGVWTGGAGTWAGNVYTPTGGESASGASITATWTVTNGTCSAADNATITIYAPVTANGGSDKEGCNTATITMTPTAPSVGAGIWTGGTGTWAGNVYTPHATESAFGAAITATWTVTNGTCVATDNATVTIYAPVIADAGTDKEGCNTATVTMTPTSPAIGTGVWTGGAGTWAGNVYTPSGGESSAGANIIATWTVTNGTCSAIDNASITIYAPVTADAGTDKEGCNTATVTMTPTSPSVGTGVWTGGLGTWAGNDYTPSGGESSAGATITATWTVTNGTCSAIDNATISIYAPVTADAGADKEGCNTATVTMIPTTPSVGTGVWTGGMGTWAANVYTPHATESASGAVITATWTVTNGTCSATDNATITIYPPSTSDAGTDKSSCVSTTITLTPVGTGTWTGGAGTFNANEYTPNLSEAGTTVTLTWTVAGVGTCPNVEDYMDVMVQPVPSAPTISASNNTPCANTSITLTATPAGGFTAQEYLWLKNGTPVNWGYSNTYTVNVGSVAGSNDYSVEIVYTGYNCVSNNSATTTVTVMAPAATITPAGPTTFCANTPSTLFATAGMTNYVWKRSGTTVQSGVSASYIPTASGNHSVIVTDANGCSKASAYTAITVKAIPTANAGVDKNVCEGASIQIGTNTVAGNTYNWSPPTALSNATIANPMASPSSTTTYTVTVTNTSTTCSNTDAVVVTTLAAPAVPTLSSTTNTVCQGSNISITPTSVGAASINWYKNGILLYNRPTNFVTVITLYTAASDAYHISAKGANGCLSASSNVINAWIKEAAVPTISSTPAAVGNSINVCVPGGTSGNALLTANSTQASPTYSWKQSVNYIPGANTNTYTATVTTTQNNIPFSVEATYPNGCVKNSLSKTVRLVTSGCVPKVGDDKDDAEMLINNEFNFSSYPNPTIGILNIDIVNSEASEGKLVLSNALGQIILEKTIILSNGQASEELNLNHLTSGVYSLSFQSEAGNYIQKVIKE